MPAIYCYTDYREYLRSRIDEKRRKNPSFSIRSAAARMNIGSGTLSRVLSGSRDIGPNLLPGIISFLKLKKREGEYFETMVRLARTTSPGRKRELYESLLRLRAVTRKTINQDQYRLFEEWHYLALHQLLRICSTCDDPEKLGAMLHPPVSKAKIRKGLDLLLRHKLIRRNSSGGFSPIDKSLTTGEVWRSMAIHGFQKSASSMAASALDTIPRAERDFSTLTIGLSEKNFLTAREIIRKARQELLALDEKEDKPERVYQINLQAFPLSNSNPPKRGEN